MIVILPGLLCNSAMFAGMLAAFPGSLCIDDHYAGCATLEAMAAHALARAPDRFTLFGHSMGARVAFEIMRCAPGRVERLILADTGTHGVRPGEAEQRYALRNIGRTNGIAALVDQWLPPMVSLPKRGDANLMATLRRMCMAAGLDGYERQIAALLKRAEVDSILTRVCCPTLVLVGSEDVWSPVEQHREITALIPGATLKVIPDAGHMMPAEAPDALNAAIAVWLTASAVKPNRAPSL